MNRENFHKLVHNWPVKILSIAAALLLFLLNRISNLEERFFSVPLDLLVEEEFTPASQYPRVVRVTLRGDSDSIYLVLEEDIDAYVDLTDHESEGIFKAPVRIRKTGTARDLDPLEIRVEPMEITVELERKLTRNVEVVPSLDGHPAPGYELVQSFLSPSSVSLEGPRSMVEEISSISTQSIELDGKKEDFSVRVRLEEIDPLIRIRGSDVVEFRANLEEAIILKTYENVDVITLGLDPDLAIESQLPDGKITVQGSQLLLEDLKPEQIRLIVDLSTIQAPGMYTLPAKPDLPRGLVVLNYEPEQLTLQVNVEEAEEAEEQEGEESDEDGEVSQ